MTPEQVEEFFRERDRRTTEYTGLGADQLRATVHVTIGAAAASGRPGQVAALGRVLRIIGVGLG